MKNKSIITIVAVLIIALAISGGLIALTQLTEDDEDIVDTQDLQDTSTAAFSSGDLNISTCAEIDVNGDGQLTIVDLSAFALVYGDSCQVIASANTCGYVDQNGDGRVTLADFSVFAEYYNQSSCTISANNFEDLENVIVWTKLDNSQSQESDTVSQNKVVDGTAGKADEYSVSAPTVFWDEERGIYLMLYQAGYDGEYILDSRPSQLSLATSLDGREWVKEDNSIMPLSNTGGTNGRIPRGTEGSGDYSRIAGGSIIKHDGKLKFWYKSIGTDERSRIFMAESEDGGLTWTKVDNSIPENSDSTTTNGRMSLGTPGKADSISVGEPEVFDRGSYLQMFYLGKDANGVTALLEARSTDGGYTWEKVDNSLISRQETNTSEGLRLTQSANRLAGDSATISKFSIVQDGNEMYMMYGAHSLVSESDDPFERNRTLYAARTENNMQRWVKFDTTQAGVGDSDPRGRILFGNDGTQDSGFILHPELVRGKDGELLLFYVGTTTGVVPGVLPPGNILMATVSGN